MNATPASDLEAFMCGVLVVAVIFGSMMAFLSGFRHR